MGNLLWARSRKQQASLMASGLEIGEESSESESIDAACRTLLGMEDGGSRDGSRTWTEDGTEDGAGEGAGAPNDGAMDDIDNEVGGVGLADIGLGEPAVPDNESHETPENEPGNDTLSASYSEDFEHRSDNQVTDDGGDQQEDNEDDDVTIRPPYTSTRPPRYTQTGAADWWEDSARLETYPLEAPRSSW